MSPLTIQSLYQYDNYRSFLEDWFLEQKKHCAVFSHRWFALKAGFSSSSFCLSVIKGRFNLSVRATEKLVKAMNLENGHASYFTALVQYNQAKTHEEREAAWRLLQELRKGHEFKKLSEAQHGYLSRWYYPVLRELAILPHWKGDFRVLARSIEPHLSTEQVREALENLVRWELLENPVPGVYRQTEVMVNAQGVPPVYLRQIRREFLERGVEALDTRNSGEYFSAFTTLGLTAEDFRQVLHIFEEARARAISKGAQTTMPDRIYELVVQVFPLSARLKGERA